MADETSAASRHTCYLELEALYFGRRDPDCPGCQSIPPRVSRVNQSDSPAP